MTPTNKEIQKQRKTFLEAGYSPIPLNPNAKDITIFGWPNMETYSLWKKAKDGSNIGLRAGDGIAFIDADEKNQIGTYNNIVNWLSGLGYAEDRLPVIQTASGIGRHIYVDIKGAILGDSRNFIPQIGKGELRFGRGSQVATFPSEVDGKSYKLIEGNIANRPVLDVKDIIGTLIPAQDNPNKEQRKKNQLLSPLALAISKGEGIEGRTDRSALDFSFCLSLINQGRGKADIKSIFDKSVGSGHYNTLTERDKTMYFERTYANALRKSYRDSDERKQIKSLINIVRSMAWSNPNDKNILLAHLNTAYATGHFRYGLDLRTISLSAGIGLETASKGTHRLLNDGYIQRMETGTAGTPSVYRIDMHGATYANITSLSTVGECTSMSLEQGFALHDAFRAGRGRLGRRAGEIYSLLFVKPLTSREIAEQTGIGMRTVERKLNKLDHGVVDYRTGEIIRMVACEGGSWKSIYTDLETISAIMGTFGKTGKQKSQYAQDRRLQEARAIHAKRALPWLFNYARPNTGFRNAGGT